MMRSEAEIRDEFIRPVTASAEMGKLACPCAFCEAAKACAFALAEMLAWALDVEDSDPSVAWTAILMTLEPLDRAHEMPPLATTDVNADALKN